MDFFLDNAAAIITGLSAVLSGLVGAFAVWLFSRAQDARKLILKRRILAHEEMIEFAKYLRMVAPVKRGERSYPKILSNKKSFIDAFNWFIEVTQKNDHWFRYSVHRETDLLLKYFLALKAVILEQDARNFTKIRHLLRTDFALFSINIEKRCISFFEREALKRWWKIPRLRVHYSKRKINKILAKTQLYLWTHEKRND